MGPYEDKLKWINVKVIKARFQPRVREEIFTQSKLYFEKRSYAALAEFANHTLKEPSWMEPEIADIELRVALHLTVVADSVQE